MQRETVHVKESQDKPTAAREIETIQVYVSPIGDDTHPGTLKAPVRTALRARDLVRAKRSLLRPKLAAHTPAKDPHSHSDGARSAPQHSSRHTSENRVVPETEKPERFEGHGLAALVPAEVLFAAGVYHFGEAGGTLSLGPEDGNTVYRAADPSSTVTFTGAVPRTLSLRPAANEDNAASPDVCVAQMDWEDEAPEMELLFDLHTGANYIWAREPNGNPFEDLQVRVCRALPRESVSSPMQPAVSAAHSSCSSCG